MKKPLILTGALALSLLASPATSLASTGEVQKDYQVQTKTIQIDSSQVNDWIKQNEEALKNGQYDQMDVQSLLKQFNWKAENSEQASVEEQPVQEQEPAQEQAAEEAAPQPAPEETTTSEEQAQQQESTQEENTSSEVSAFEKEVVELTNQEREKQGLEPLKLDTELSGAAKDKSLDMQNNDYFSHTSPTYGSPFDMMDQYGIDYRTAGENIAMGQTSPEQVVEGWMNSQGHRENIMNPDFTHIGVGHAEEGNYWTQMFIGK
ncbi:CAP domain-containing protein [Halobacillus litoralis]|uniref:CAP domain-containing protein n=1 Tax=Halobacillus litoralis TaxID=45668 RepID=UPI001CD4D544|nr:CAP domain-containing protein [Halobacillus litoralis]MCA1022225.1 CAP domain-containing protein [Halobacillus litoralis]